MEPSQPCLPLIHNYPYPPYVSTTNQYKFHQPLNRILSTTIMQSMNLSNSLF